MGSFGTKQVGFRGMKPPVSAVSITSCNVGTGKDEGRRRRATPYRIKRFLHSVRAGHVVTARERLRVDAGGRSSTAYCRSEGANSRPATPIKSRSTVCGGCITRRRYAIDRQDRLGFLGLE